MPVQYTQQEWDAMRERAIRGAFEMQKRSRLPLEEVQPKSVPAKVLAGRPELIKAPPIPQQSYYTSRHAIETIQLEKPLLQKKREPPPAQPKPLLQQLYPDLPQAAPIGHNTQGTGKSQTANQARRQRPPKRKRWLSRNDSAPQPPMPQPQAAEQHAPPVKPLPPHTSTAAHKATQPPLQQAEQEKDMMMILCLLLLLLEEGADQFLIFALVYIML